MVARRTSVLIWELVAIDPGRHPLPVDTHPKDFVTNRIKSIAVPMDRRVGRNRERVAPADSAYEPATAQARRGKSAAVHSSHRFAVGDQLQMAQGGRDIARAASICEVIALLPNEGGPLRYRVRSENEGFERIVEERDLEPLATGLE